MLAVATPTFGCTCARSIKKRTNNSVIIHEQISLAELVVVLIQVHYSLLVCEYIVNHMHVIKYGFVCDQTFLDVLHGTNRFSMFKHLQFQQPHHTASNELFPIFKQSCCLHRYCYSH